jgi:branched-chain amino acid transport system substrate-binding protein
MCLVKVLCRWFRSWARDLACAAILLVAVPLPVQATGEQAVLVGLDADMSSGSSQSGIAIRRGIEIAIAEINAAGGVLGRPLALVVRDHRGNPTRGEENIRQFAAMPRLVAVVGGLHTPVAMHELKAIHELGVPYLGPWAAGTPIVDNGYEPNFVFRVSVRDSDAAGFLVRKAMRRGFSRLGLLLEETGWGRSNERAMRAALAELGGAEPMVRWFHWGTTDFGPMLEDFSADGIDAILLVANAPEGLALVRSLASRQLANRLPVLSHWGITGGEFALQAAPYLADVDLTLIQTFSFTSPRHADRAERVAEAYLSRYPDTRLAAGIPAPVVTAHAYDLVHLLRLAIERAGTTDRAAVRDALEGIESYRGLVKDYRPPFTPRRHDALDESDFHLARFDVDGSIRYVD